MGSSRQLIALGVGALLAFNTASPGAAKPAPDPSKSDTNINPQAAPLSGSVPESVNGLAPDAAQSIAQPRTNSPTRAVAQTAEVVKVTPARIAQPTKTAPVVVQNPGASSTPAAPVTPNPGSNPNIPGSNPNIPTDPNLQPSQTQPIGPAKPGSAPTYLNPDPNPLQFPTRPSEVRLQGIQPITLQQAIELAQRNNRNLQVIRLQADRSRSGLREAQAELYPTLGVQTGLTRSQSAGGELSQRRLGGTQSLLEQLGGADGQSNQDRASNNFNGTASLSYDVFTSGGRPARIRAAERQLRSDELQVEITEEQLRLDVTGDYYDLQEADESVRINEAAVRNAEVSLRDTQALERAGLGTRFETLQAQVQLANAQQDLTNSRATQQIRRRQLAQRLSVVQYVDLATADPVDVAGNWTLPLEDSIVLAFKNRAELEQQLVQRDLNEQQRRAALATLGPTISVSADYQILNSLDDDLGFADGYTLSAGIRWNFFDGGAAAARARQAEINGAIAETRFADNRNQIRFQVEQAYTTLLSSSFNIQTATVALGQARESLRLARLRFQAGVGTQTDVINAETALTRAEGNRITAVLGYNRALAQLQRAISNLPSTRTALSTGAGTAPANGTGTNGTGTTPPPGTGTVP